MDYSKLNKGHEILYKYTDGELTKFRTTPIIKTLRELNEKLKELDSLEMVISVVVREIKYKEYGTT
jgi:hypothetical protein